MDYLLIKGLIKALVLPPVGLILLGLIGTFVARRRPFGHVLTALSLSALLAMSLPIVAYTLTEMLAAPAPFQPDQPVQAKAIVIPAGGLRENAPEYGGISLSALTLERVRYGAALAKRTGLPVLVSGGIEAKGKVEAEVMRAALVEEFGVVPKWLEPRSKNTRENALFAAQILRPHGIERIALVGHVFDIKRFSAEFERAGFSVIAAPTGLRTPIELSWRDWVPSMRAIEAAHFACYELVANAAEAVSSALALVLPHRLIQ